MNKKITEELPMNLVVRKEISKKDDLTGRIPRPLEGYVLKESKPDKTESYIRSKRNLPLKFKTIEQVFEAIRQRTGRKEHRVKISFPVGEGFVEGNMIFYPHGK